MECCCHAWAGALSCYWGLLGKLQIVTNIICRNVASLSLVYSYYFGICSSELSQLVPVLYSQGSSTRCYVKLHDFPVTSLRRYQDVYVSSFFPHTARLWSSLPIECFLLTYDLNGFKSRINRYHLTVGPF